MHELEGLIKKAEKKADEIEIYKRQSSNNYFKTVLDRIESCDYTSTQGYGLRVVKNGRLGFSYFSKKSEFDKALKNAIHASKFSKKLNIHFPSRQKYQKIKGMYNKKLEKPDEKLIDELLSMIDVFEKRKSRSIQNYLSATTMNSTLVNSNDVYYEEKENHIDVTAIAQYKESRSYDFKVSREAVDGIKIAEHAANLAEHFEGGKKISGEFDIILHPKVAMELFDQVFLSSIDGEQVFRKQSYFTDKLNKVVVNEKISMYDDPLKEKGISSYASDDEGIKARKKAIVEKGVLKSFIYDLESSYLAKKKPTGNGLRDSSLSTPSTDLSNLEMKSTEKEKLSEIDGVFIYDVIGVHNTNHVTGDFSLEITNGCLWKGSMGKPIRKCSLVGNYFELLKNFRLADDEQIISWYYGPSWIYQGVIK